MGRKIGIITFHFCLNYGAVLQCYALVNYFKEKGVDVYTLNAVSRKQEKNNSMYRGKTGLKKLIRNTVLLPLHYKRIKKEKKFKSFVESELNCTERVSTAESLKDLINKKNYDYIISGSDQVWNPYNNDFEDMFFFPFECLAKKIGYAVSLSTATSDDLYPYKEYIKDFQAVGVREHASIKIIEKYNETIVENVDPVLLLDSEKWGIIANRSSLEIDTPYLLSYFVNKKSRKFNIGVATYISNKLGLKTVIINAGFGTYSYMPNTLVDVGPEDFIKLIKNASYVYTDSFHGTVFSVLMNKNFSSYVESSMSTDSRIKDFLEKINLQNRILFGDKCKREVSWTPVDYSNINTLIDEISKPSKAFLEEYIY